MKKTLYVAIFILVGVLYADLGVEINDYLAKCFPWLNYRYFFAPLLFIDIMISVVYLKIINISLFKFPKLFILYLLIGIVISLITSIGYIIAKWMIIMDF